MNTDLMFSSKNENWETPQDFFDALDNEFHFTLDPCANDENHKVPKYFTKEMDGLSLDWGGEITFCNPPYGKQIGKWVKKAYDEHFKTNHPIVMLIPARTDTSYFHNYIYGIAEIRFIRGRLKFTDEYGVAKDPAPFPSMVVVFNPRNA